MSKMNNIHNDGNGIKLIIWIVMLTLTLIVLTVRKINTDSIFVVLNVYSMAVYLDVFYVFTYFKQPTRHETKEHYKSSQQYNVLNSHMNPICDHKILNINAIYLISMWYYSNCGKDQRQI